MIKTKYYACDFETVVTDHPETQEQTEVWAAAWVEVGKTNYSDVHISNNINDWFSYMARQKGKVICSFHNLKWDGTFILDFLHDELGYSEALEKVTRKKKNTNEEYTSVGFKLDKDMEDKTYKYVISDVGQWYSITVKVFNHIIEIRDSLKLIPLSIKDMGSAFNTKNRKLEIEYIGHLHKNETITPEEKKYIANDVLVLSEVLYKCYQQDMKKLTIGSNCMATFKELLGRDEYKYIYPQLDEIELDFNEYGSYNADEYIRKSYKGGFCWVNPKKQGKVINTGSSADVNSLYPSQMHSSSGSYYPFGTPKFFKGKPDPKLFYDKSKYLFVRFTCGFKLKENKMPTVQIKNSCYYFSNIWLTTSMLKNSMGEYCDTMTNFDGEVEKIRPEFTMTETDFLLFVKHYDIWDMNILDYCVFNANSGVFDEYVDRFMKQKIEANNNKGLRQISKLYLNNLYGKFATNNNNSFKLFSYDPEELDIAIESYTKKSGYIAIGSAITSYARNFIITQAMKFYPEKLCYIDTDSIHIEGTAKELEAVLPIDEVKLNHFKIEGEYDKGYYYRQKFYVEREKGQTDYKLLICGIPMNCKEEINDKLISGNLDLLELTKGFSISGKLIPKRIKGGCVLIPIDFEVR